MNIPASARRLVAAACALGAAALLPSSPACASDIEVVHWWTSGGEAKSVEELKKMMVHQGFAWRDASVANADAAVLDLNKRIATGQPPTAAQIKGPDIQAWGRKGVLANLDDVAAEGDWDVKLPRTIAAQMKVDGHWAAVPVNVHRVNWLWINRELLQKVGGRVPDSWDQFFSLAERFQKAGIVALARGGQPWQDLQVFENVVLGIGGPEFYRQAFVKMDPAAWRSDTMGRVVDTFRHIKPYTDKDSGGRDWNVATAMVIKGTAGMLIMGDWAKGEFLAAGKKPDKDFICTATPGTWSAFDYNIDSFAMFKQKDPQAMAGQKAFAATIMSPAFQELFNRNKGSIPAALGANMAGFDFCARESSGYFAASSLANSLVPSFADGMAQPDVRVSAVTRIVARVWDDDGYPTSRAMADLSAAATATAATASAR